MNKNVMSCLASCWTKLKLWVRAYAPYNIAAMVFWRPSWCNRVHWGVRPLRNLWVHAVALSMHSTRSQLRLFTWHLRRLHMGMFLARRCLSLPRWRLGGTSSAIRSVWVLRRWVQGWRPLVGVCAVVC